MTWKRRTRPSWICKEPREHGSTSARGDRRSRNLHPPGSKFHWSLFDYVRIRPNKERRLPSRRDKPDGWEAVTPCQPTPTSPYGCGPRTVGTLLAASSASSQMIGVRAEFRRSFHQVWRAKALRSLRRSKRYSLLSNRSGGEMRRSILFR